MNFQDLHERLRLELLRRIDQGTLTGTRLAQQTGFRQAHISNFLNRKRALSLEGLDRVLTAQELGIEQILPLTIEASHDRPLPTESSLESPLPQETSAAVPVVSQSAMVDEGQIQPANVIEVTHVSASRLSENRTRVSRRQASWQRFVAMRAGGQETSAMHPFLLPGTIAVVDRHYNSIVSYRAEQPTLLAIRYGSGLLLRFVELDGGRLVLRPSSIEHPLHFVTVRPTDTASDYIVGRVCLLLHEL